MYEAQTFSNVIQERETVAKARTFAEVIKFNPYHDSHGRFSSANGAASFTFRTKDPAKQKYADAAVAREKERARAAAGGGAGGVSDYGSTKIEIDSDMAARPEQHSLMKHLDKNGNLTPEREALHRKIVEEALQGVEKSEDPTFYMMGGGPAAGKSTMVNTGAVKIPDEKHGVYVDPDAIKAKLPEYQQMIKAGDQNAARYAHEESSALAKRVYEVAAKNGYDVVYDGTGDGSVGSVKKKLATATANGMKTKGVYATVPTETAVQRANARAAKTGRVVPEEQIRGTHKKVSQILPEVASMFDSVELYDTTNGAKLIATGGNGKGLVAKDEKLFAAFLAKANE